MSAILWMFSTLKVEEGFGWFTCESADTLEDCFCCCGEVDEVLSVPWATKLWTWPLRELC